MAVIEESLKFILKSTKYKLNTVVLILKDIETRLLR